MSAVGTCPIENHMALIEQTQDATPEKKKPEEQKVREDSDFLFNPISANQLQEYTVVKTNNRGKRQQRVFGIDGHFIYNDLPSEKPKSGIKKLSRSAFQIFR